MPRPRSKDELLKAINDEFAKLLRFIKNVPRDILEGDFTLPLRDNSRDKNARDVLIHLYEWHKMLEHFVANNLECDGKRFTQRAQVTPFLPLPHNWRTYPKLNIEFWQKHQSTPLQVALDALQTSHSTIANIVQKFSDDELFCKGHFACTGANALGSFVISSTSSHYAWAIKQLKNGIISNKGLR
ncbi:ClbS/DfsB family four-helix bundle protein [Helicobacter sp. 23-1045]